MTYFHPYIPISTNIFQTGWNHQLVIVESRLPFSKVKDCHMLFSRGHLNCGSLPRMEFIEVGRVWRYCWCGFNIRRSPSRCRKIYGKTPKYLLRSRCFRYPLGGSKNISSHLDLYGTSGAYFGPTVKEGAPWSWEWCLSLHGNPPRSSWWVRLEQVPSLKRSQQVCTWKWIVGRWLFPFRMA